MARSPFSPNAFVLSSRLPRTRKPPNRRKRAVTITGNEHSRAALYRSARLFVFNDSLWLKVSETLIHRNRDKQARGVVILLGIVGNICPIRPVMGGVSTIHARIEEVLS